MFPNLDANNLIYLLDPDTGTAISRRNTNMPAGFESANPTDPAFINNFNNFDWPAESAWAGTNVVAQVQIPTVSPVTGASTGNVTSLVTEINGGTFLYAYTDAGAVWRMVIGENTGGNYSAGDLRGFPELIVDPTTPGAVGGVDFITDLNGSVLAFDQVTKGPANFVDVNDTEGIKDLYFGVGRPVGTTDDLRFYAFDLTTRTARPIFTFGADSILVDNNNAAGDFAGFFFSPLDQTLWHLSDTLRTEPGHGFNALDDREAVIGGGSLRFGFDALNDDFNHLSGQDADGQLGGIVSDNSDGNNDLDAVDLQNFSGYNFLGGAHGTVQSNSLDLSGFSSQDLPTLYFTYILDTENVNADDSPGGFNAANLDDVMRDSLRVMVAGEDGRWQFVATNNMDDALNNRVWDDSRGSVHEYDPVGSQGYTNVFQQRFVQELFDDDVFRQARIDLGPWAGQENVRIRFDFSTAGEARPDQSEIHALPGVKLTDGQTLLISGLMPERTTDFLGDALSVRNKSFEFDLGLVVQMPAGSQVSAPIALKRPDGSTIVELVPGIAGSGQVGVLATDSAADVALKVIDLIGGTAVQNGSQTSWVSFTGETAQGTYTFGVLDSSIVSIPGVSPSSISIPVDFTMSDLEVRDAIQLALANEIHYVDTPASLAAFPVVGTSNAVRIYDLAVSQTFAQQVVSQAGNDTIATAQDLDGERWTLGFDSNVDSSTTRPHLSILGLGDDTYDYYAFTVSQAVPSQHLIWTIRRSIRNCTCSMRRATCWQRMTMTTRTCRRATPAAHPTLTLSFSTRLQLPATTSSASVHLIRRLVPGGLLALRSRSAQPTNFISRSTGCLYPHQSSQSH